MDTLTAKDRQKIIQEYLPMNKKDIIINFLTTLFVGLVIIYLTLF